ncbi:MAG: cbb3-type cytochrome c oxidase subunit II [Verrucomicrobiota bacterium]|jgi:cytochrome c oxidase cbb3-type subunit 2
MKNGPLFILGLFAALALSFGGIVLGSHQQLGTLAPYYDDTEAQAFPLRPPGVAARGQLVYADLGCASCHTQRVRRPDAGSDKARGWGDRQSVARDYIHQVRPQLGASRFGPDLTNYGRRAGNSVEETTAALDAFLFTGSANHPSYKFLFDTTKISGETAARALKIGVVGHHPEEQIVPTERARTLVAYLLSLGTTYDYPESLPFTAHAVDSAKGEHTK